MKDFLIRFSSVDRPWAEWIAWQLATNGYSAILANQEEAGSDNSGLPGPAEGTRQAILVLSPNAVDVIDPLKAGISDGGLIGVCVKPVALPRAVRIPAVVELTDLNETEAASLLLQAVRKASSHPPSPIEPAPGAITHDYAPTPSFPLALPPVWHLPSPRNPHFTGRESALARIAEGFRGDHQPVPIQTIRGMAGIGKTQLAIEYAHRHAGDYQAVWWIHAGSEEEIAAAYSAFAQAANLDGSDQGEGKRNVDAVRQWMQANGSWLFIFDDVIDPEAATAFLPVRPAGHVLITSRHQTWEKVCPSIAIDRWSRKESMDFLLKRIDDCDRSGAEKIADGMKGLPLAMDQAVRYMDRNRISCVDYVTRYQTRFDELWREKRLPLNYPHTLGTTLSLALEKIQEETPIGSLILSLCSHVAPDNVPRFLIDAATAHMPEAWSALFDDASVLNEGIDALRRFGLVEVRADRLSTQRLVQVASRDRLHLSERKLWSEVAIRAVDDVIFTMANRDCAPFSKGVVVLPHARAAAAHAVEQGVALTTAADVYRNCGRHLYACGDVRLAESYLYRSLEIYEKDIKQNSADVALTADMLAGWLHARGAHDHAEALYHQSLKRLEEGLGSDDPIVAFGLNNLALLLHEQNRFAQAEHLFRRALEIHEAQPEDAGTDTALVASNLALVLQDLGKVAEAETLYRRALEIKQSSLGDDHLDVAISLSDLASALQDQDDYAQAEVFCRRALEIRQSQLGDEHPAVADSLHALATVLHDRNNFAQAESLYRRALVIFEQSTEEEASAVAVCLNNLARLIHENGDAAQAESYYRRALKIRQSQFGEEHPAVAVCLNNLARLLHDQNDGGETESLYRRALNILEACLGSDHPDFLVGLDNLARLLDTQNRPQEAAVLWQRIPSGCLITD